VHVPLLRMRCWSSSEPLFKQLIKGAVLSLLGALRSLMG